MTNTNNAKLTNQRIQPIRLTDISPSLYQRSTNPRQISNIVNFFDDAKVGLLTVSERDGKYHLIDGAHRSVAMRQLGFTHAMCLVLTGLTIEDEADYFRRQNENLRRLEPLDLYKAGLIAKNDVCLRIDEIVKMNGFQIGRSKDFRTISCVQAVMTIISEYGDNVLDDTLCLIANTWYGIEKATQREFLIGVAEFVKRYGMCEFAERMKDKMAAVWYEYCEEQRYSSRSLIGNSSSRRKFCKALVRNYNRGLRCTSKKYLQWED